jgi:hypothetical protein
MFDQLYLFGNATYSAIALPFWSRDMYFRSCKYVRAGFGASSVQITLTFWVYDTVVEVAMIAVCV